MEQEKKQISIHQIIWYVIIFSVIGLVIETIFCYITTGVIESRKGLVWGPFCPVYGVGAAVLILVLNRYKNSYFTLFIYGSILGNVIEYLLSYVLEAMYGTRFWDYAFIAGNLNGRICMTYSIFWGILAVGLIKFVKPVIDNSIDRIPKSKRKIINSIIVILFIIDAIATVWAVNSYKNRAISKHYDVTLPEKKAILTKIEENLFSNTYMLKTFPNLRYIDNERREYYIRDIIKAEE